MREVVAALEWADMVSIDDRLNAIIRELIGNGITLEQAVEAFEGKYIVAAMTASRPVSKPTVFISHCASDAGFANVLRVALTKRGIQVWNPDSELLPGDNWLLKAGLALGRADAVVFLLSAESAESPSAKRELQYVTAQSKFEHRVFPVLVGRDVSKIPWVLRDLVITGNTESVAREIAARLQPDEAPANPRRPAVFKRRMRSTASAAVPSKAAAKHQPKRARRTEPAG